tara:strand:+ start:1712 stop:2875 length:1164 start_codon:yes stop_codon:yes gene_type:complete
MAETDEPIVKEEETESRFSVELSEDVISEVEKSVLESNNGKAKEELADEIEAAKVARLKTTKTENASLMSKAEELAKDEDNAEKTDDEIMALAQAAIVEDVDTDKENESLTGFFGKGSKSKGKEEGKDKTTNTNLSPEIQAKLTRLEKIEKDDFFRSVLEGDDVSARAFADKVIKSGYAFDVNATTPLQLKAEELRRLKEANPTLITDETVEDEMDAFKDRSEIEKIKDVAIIKAQIAAEQTSFFDSLGLQVTSDANASRNMLSQSVKEAETELKNNYLGVEVFPSRAVDQEMMSTVLNSIRSRGITAKTTEGKPDIKKTIEEQLIVLNYSDSLDAAYARGRKDESRKNNIKQGKPSGLKFRSKTANKTPVDAKKALRDAQAKAGMI